MDLQQWNMPSLSYAAWNVYTVALREAHSNLRLYPPGDIDVGTLPP